MDTQESTLPTHPLKSILMIFLFFTFLSIAGCATPPEIQPVLDLEETTQLPEDQKVMAKESEPVASLPIKADLVPMGKALPDGSVLKGPEAFCHVKDKDLIIMVKNKGQMVSPPSTTSVVFFSRGSGSYKRFDLETPPVEAKEVELSIPLPPNACVLEECIFSITVDSKNNIEEGPGENNNQVDGLCLI